MNHIDNIRPIWRNVKGKSVRCGAFPLAKCEGEFYLISYMKNDMLRIDFAKVELLRREGKLSQAALAKAGKLGLRTYSRIASAAQGDEESAKRDFRLSTVDGLAQALGVNPKSILVDD